MDSLAHKKAFSQLELVQLALGLGCRDSKRMLMGHSVKLNFQVNLEIPCHWNPRYLSERKALVVDRYLSDKKNCNLPKNTIIVKK